ncbi:hypothetical protein CS022_07755 [Veronia nyctiphanis]|uniref:Uncharacterized protein n=1 Tax=Veronia nyctiphanis TaxID=1278244 RepID=A0A4Q0YWP1_9GAMM|nr:hypothetical protein [Veronia nyctiphanis]RXJ73639.1 hypothetical protein CS022_07755 [Veronia nyctiphanis]
MSSTLERAGFYQKDASKVSENTSSNERNNGNSSSENTGGRRKKRPSSTRTKTPDMLRRPTEKMRIKLGRLDKEKTSGKNHPAVIIATQYSQLYKILLLRVPKVVEGKTTFS